MKGVILGLHPRVTLVDVTHEIAPQDVRGGAFVLHTVHPYFPPGTVHLAVVDPGVGTERAAVILDTGRALFVAPDNGLLSFVLGEAGEPRLYTLPRPLSESGVHGEGRNDLRAVPLPRGWRAVQIAESRYWLPKPSDTFHGRDIFAPVAAHLSSGEPVGNFGPQKDVLRAFPVPRAVSLPDGTVVGEVIHVDRFGNLITSVRAEDLPGGEVAVEVAGRRIEGLSGSYAEGVGLIALVGSSGHLEVALPNGSALGETGQDVGAPVRVVPVARRFGREVGPS